MGTMHELMDNGMRLEIQGMDLLGEIFQEILFPLRVARILRTCAPIAGDSAPIVFQIRRQRRGFRPSRLFPAAAR